MAKQNNPKPTPQHHPIKPLTEEKGRTTPKPPVKPKR
jgi:hypothetical protein